MSKDRIRKNTIRISKMNKIGLLCAYTSIIILVCLIISCAKNETEVFSFHEQTVQLFADGCFIASLSHGVQINGTYTKTTENDRINILFNVNGNTVTGRVINNALHIPKEWDDGHGHGNVFPKVNKTPSNQEHKHN